MGLRETRSCIHNCMLLICVLYNDIQVAYAPHVGTLFYKATTCDIYVSSQLCFCWFLIHVWTMIACFLVHLRNLKKKNPHTHVFSSHMVVTVYNAVQVAYVPQAAFIYNATIRDNILFGQPYDAERYSRAIQSSSLVHDLQQFPGNLRDGWT